MADPLLVATDGGSNAAGALTLAAKFAEERGAPVEVVSVVEPLSDLPMALPHREELEEARARAIASRVRDHVRDTVGPVDWPVHVRLGRPAPAICTTARARNARMVVLGMDADASDGNATAVELLHLATKPVLIAHDGHLPRRAAVGIDFRPSSMRATEEVARIIGPKGELHLIHVKSDLDFPAANVWNWSDCYDCAIRSAFDRLVAGLRENGTTKVEYHCLSGDPSRTLMEKAQELDVDLLGIGSDGYICNGRVVVGRVARHVLAEATVPVLASPVSTAMDGPFAELPDPAPQVRAKS